MILCGRQGSERRVTLTQQKTRDDDKSLYSIPFAGDPVKLGTDPATGKQMANLAFKAVETEATGRGGVIKFAGCYHGHGDSLLVKAGSGVATLGIPGSAGVPEEFAKLTLALPYNDTKAVERGFREFRGEIACVIVEPVVGNMGCVPPAAGFLDALRYLTSREGALLIFDEVITGFRVAPGGAQALYGVTPDITTMAKALGGGLPIVAVLMTDAVAGALAVGDVFICNHPSEGGLPRVPDLAVIAPVIVDGERLGFSGSIAHKADVGGTVGRVVRVHPEAQLDRVRHAIAVGVDLRSQIEAGLGLALEREAVGVALRDHGLEARLAGGPGGLAGGRAAGDPLRDRGLVALVGRKVVADAVELVRQVVGVACSQGSRRGSEELTHGRRSFRPWHVAPAPIEPRAQRRGACLPAPEVSRPREVSLQRAGAAASAAPSGRAPRRDWPAPPARPRATAAACGRSRSSGRTRP